MSVRDHFGGASAWRRAAVAVGIIAALAGCGGVVAGGCAAPTERIERRGPERCFTESSDHRKCPECSQTIWDRERRALGLPDDATTAWCEPSGVTIANVDRAAAASSGTMRRASLRRSNAVATFLAPGVSRKTRRTQHPIFQIAESNGTLECSLLASTFEVSFYPDSDKILYQLKAEYFLRATGEPAIVPLLAGAEIKEEGLRRSPLPDILFLHMFMPGRSYYDHMKNPMPELFSVGPAGIRGASHGTYIGSVMEMNITPTSWILPELEDECLQFTMVFGYLTGSAARQSMAMQADGMRRAAVSQFLSQQYCVLRAQAGRCRSGIWSSSGSLPLPVE